VTTGDDAGESLDHKSVAFLTGCVGSSGFTVSLNAGFNLPHENSRGRDAGIVVGVLRMSRDEASVGVNAKFHMSIGTGANIPFQSAEPTLNVSVELLEQVLDVERVRRHVGSPSWFPLIYS
jgi:hypothetical protein